MSKIKLIKSPDQPKQNEILHTVRSILGQISDIAICIYLLLIIAVMPFYSTSGYNQIGTDKNTFFISVSTNMGKLLIPLLLLYLLVHIIILFSEKKQLPKAAHESGSVKSFFFHAFSLTDIFALCFGAAAVISYFSSDYREQALWGAERWYMGLFSQLTFLCIYFFLSRLWKKRKWLSGLFLPVSAVVFFLGYLNRFGIYPIEMEGATPTFISTIGNINWYCGYMVTVLFGGIYLLWYGTCKKPWQRVLLNLYVGLGFATLVTHGSSSGILALLVILFTLFLLSASDGSRFQAFLEIVFTLAVVCTITYVIRLLFPEAMTYIEATADLFTLSILPVIMLVGAGLLLLYVRHSNHRNKYPASFFRRFAGIVSVTVAAAFVGLIVLIIVNTLRPGSIGPLSELSVFTFSPDWGSKRGATWSAGIMCFLEQNVWKKLVGVGPDCMWPYIFSDGSSELLNLVRESFGYYKLTNAHNEWLTMLVNVGLIGMVSYAGMIVSAIARYLKISLTGKEKTIHKAIAGACGLSVLAYTINNIVSFQQSMSAVTMFVILGIGEAYATENDKKDYRFPKREVQR